MPITVIDVIRDMGIEPSNELSWSIGAAVRTMYEKKHGRKAPKDLRPKTNAGGTHCFNIYPDSLRPEIERIIRAHRTEKRRQGDLF